MKKLLCLFVEHVWAKKATWHDGDRINAPRGRNFQCARCGKRRTWWKATP